MPAKRTATSLGKTMPAKSEAQRRKLNATFGHEWVKEHGFDNKGKLPERIHPKKKKKRTARKVEPHHAYHGGT